MAGMKVRRRNHGEKLCALEIAKIRSFIGKRGGKQK
jgi:hypothetical protein